MFSVPESIEIRAPAESANHSTGTDICSARSSAAMIRGALGLGDRARAPWSGRRSSTTRVMPSGCRSVGVVTTADDDAGLVEPGRRSTGTSAPVVVEVVLDEGAAGAGQHAGCSS